MKRLLFSKHLYGRKHTTILCLDTVHFEKPMHSFLTKTKGKTLHLTIFHVHYLHCQPKHHSRQPIPVTCDHEMVQGHPMKILNYSAGYTAVFVLSSEHRLRQWFQATAHHISNSTTCLSTSMPSFSRHYTKNTSPSGLSVAVELVNHLSE